jgi:hypothetical protein
MDENQGLKERLRVAATALAPQMALTPVVRRARVLRARRIVSGVLAVAVGLAVVAVPLAGLRHLGEGPPPPAASLPPAVVGANHLSFKTAAGWNTIDSKGPMHGPHSGQGVSSTWTTTQPLASLGVGRADRNGDGVIDRPTTPSIARLPADGIAIAAAITDYGGTPAQPNVNFKAATLPLTIAQQGCGEFEGMPRPDTSECRQLVTVNGHWLEVRSYFGVANPGADLIARANAQLAGLEVPAAPTFGITARMPDGWAARTTYHPGLKGVSLVATTTSVHRAVPPFADGVPIAGPDDAWVGVTEVSGLCPCGGFAPTTSVGTFAPSDWYRPDPIGSDRETRLFQNEGGYLRLVTVAGRAFVVWAQFPSRPASSDLLAQANDVLASIHIDPSVGDVGRVRPPELMFGTDLTGYTQGVAWASNRPFNTEDLVFTGLSGSLTELPFGTLDSLQHHQWLIVATSRRPSAGLLRPLPLHLWQGLIVRRWEGAPRGVIYYALSGLAGRRWIDVRAYFGSWAPTVEARFGAQAILDRLRVAS